MVGVEGNELKKGSSKEKRENIERRGREGGSRSRRVCHERSRRVWLRDVFPKKHFQMICQINLIFMLSHLTIQTDCKHTQKAIPVLSWWLQ